MRSIKVFLIYNLVKIVIFGHIKTIFAFSLVSFNDKKRSLR